MRFNAVAAVVALLMGGITAVVWTDVVQMLMAFAGIIVAVVVLFSALPGEVGVGDIVYIGGIQQMWRSIDLSWHWPTSAPTRARSSATSPPNL